MKYTILLGFLVGVYHFGITQVTVPESGNSVNKTLILNDSIYTIVEEMPRFFSPKCEALENKSERESCSEKALLSFLFRNIKLSNLEEEHFWDDKVVIQCDLDTIGMMSNLIVLRGSDPFAKGVMDALKQVPRWTIAKHRGCPVKVRMRIPVNIKLAR